MHRLVMFFFKMRPWGSRWSPRVSKVSNTLNQTLLHLWSSLSVVLELRGLGAMSMLFEPEKGFRCLS